MCAVVTIAVALLLAAAVQSVSSQCAPSATSDTVPANPGFTFASVPTSAYGSVVASSGCSELVTVVTMGSYSASTFSWPRTSCPHLAAGLTPLDQFAPGLAAGNDLVLNSGDQILVQQCGLPAAGGVLN